MKAPSTEESDTLGGSFHFSNILVHHGKKSTDGTDTVNKSSNYIQGNRAGGIKSLSCCFLVLLCVCVCV